MINLINQVKEYLIAASYGESPIKFYTDGLWITADGKTLYTNHARAIYHGELVIPHFPHKNKDDSIQQALNSGWIRVTWTIDGRYDPRVDSMALNITTYTKQSKAALLKFWEDTAFKYQKFGVKSIRGYEEFETEKLAYRYIRYAFTLTQPL